jgi:diguanylate cyclase (GGDEF)-like protein
MATPIHGRNEIYGVLIVHRIEPRPYSTTDVAFLEAIAGVLSQAAIRAETEEALRHLALHDVLTGLPNRTLISDRLQHALALRKNRSSGLAVLMIDLDGFKLVNDSFGHAAGDEVLITFAQRMVRLLRRGDTLGRLGGDEFVVIAEELSGQNAILELARRIVAAAEEPFRFGADESTISASVGIAFSSPELQGTNDLLRAADAAMYRAKRQRRGLALHDERRDTAENMRSRIALALRSALDQERVDVVYQPIWRIDDGTIVAFEALARWYDEAMGEIPPSMFVPLAEDLGAVDVLGQLVLRRACSAVAQLRRTIPAMRVHVNVSPRELAHPLYVSRLRDVLNETGTSADGLALELTEAVLVEDFVEASQRIARLHELGITLQLDDFGTGYSSLSYLQRLPQISALKIDRSFIRPIRAGSQAPIVVAIVSMARALGKTVIAEGVERDEQRRWLAQLGCSYGQGWLHGKPLPEAALHALVCGRPSARSPS